MKPTVTSFEFTDLLDALREGCDKHYKKIEPFLKQAYEILAGTNDPTFRPAIYDLNLHLEKQYKTLYSDNHNIYAGIIEPGILKGNSKGLYLKTDSIQWLIIFCDDIRKVKSHTHLPGVYVYRVFNEIDVDCIEKAWRVDNTLKWCTKLDLAAETFTDVTEYSQKIGDHVVCKRPTINRVITDFNNEEFLHYENVYTNAIGAYSTLDMAHVKALFFYMLVLCSRLKIEGTERF